MLTGREVYYKKSTFTKQKHTWMTPLFTFPDWDVQLFEKLNSIHHPWLDPLMWFLSSPWSWIILFGILSVFMLHKSRFWGMREIILILTTVAVNSIVNNIIKYFVQRPRPCHEILDSTIRILEDCGENSSFFSAHSSNAFCLAIGTALFFKNKYYSFFIILWATIVAYSRIYVGKHYPLDVICGIAFGIIMSFAGNYFLKRYREQKPYPESH